VSADAQAGILDRLYNLQCDDGHRWFAPNPQAFTDRLCHHPDGDELRADGTPRLTVPRCQKPLAGLKVTLETQRATR
jgi:hypothetical protein